MSRNAIAMLSALVLAVTPACYDADDDTELEEGLEETTDEIAAGADELESEFDEGIDAIPSTEAEWDVWWTERRGELDVDAEEGLGEDEFYTVVADLWDADRDGRISTQDWNEVSAGWFEGTKSEWTEWDSDGDGYLNESEVREGARIAGLYDRVDMDGDGTVQDEELRQWYLQLLDEGAYGEPAGGNDR